MNDSKDIYRGQLKFRMSRLLGIESVRALNSAIENKQSKDKFKTYLKKSTFGLGTLVDFDKANEAEYTLKVVFNSVDDISQNTLEKVRFSFGLRDNPGKLLDISNEYFVDHFKLSYYELIVTIPESFKGYTDEFVKSLRETFMPYVSDEFYDMKDDGFIGAYISDTGETKTVTVRSRARSGYNEIKNNSYAEYNNKPNRCNSGKQAKLLCPMCDATKNKLNPFCSHYNECKKLAGIID